MRVLSFSIKTLLAFVLLLAASAAITLFLPVSVPKDGAVFYVEPGVKRENLVDELSGIKLIRLAPLFEIYTRMKGISPRTGEYLFRTGSTPYSIWKQISTGTGRYYRTFTIIPGWTFKQIKSAMWKEKTIKHLIDDLPDTTVMRLMGDEGRSPEGMFLPESYYYSRNDADLVILKRAHELMKSRLAEAWEGRAANLPYKDSYQALIAASLIEKEAYLPSEQPVIGGVLVNRLRKNMLLQFDPTVIYGLGDSYDGKIYKKDLTADTPYNTYIHKGLTPTPIAMPGYSAMLAALHPQEHQYLYFVAKGDGSHEFTTNLQSHVTAVKKAAIVKANKAATAAVPEAANATR